MKVACKCKVLLTDYLCGFDCIGSQIWFRGLGSCTVHVKKKIRIWHNFGSLELQEGRSSEHRPAKPPGLGLTSLHLHDRVTAGDEIKCKLIIKRSSRVSHANLPCFVEGNESIQLKSWENHRAGWNGLWGGILSRCGADLHPSAGEVCVCRWDPHLCITLLPALDFGGTTTASPRVIWRLHACPVQYLIAKSNARSWEDQLINLSLPSESQGG